MLGPARRGRSERKPSQPDLPHLQALGYCLRRPLSLPGQPLSLARPYGRAPQPQPSMPQGKARPIMSVSPRPTAGGGGGSSALPVAAGRPVELRPLAASAPGLTAQQAAPRRARLSDRLPCPARLTIALMPAARRGPPGLRPTLSEASPGPLEPPCRQLRPPAPPISACGELSWPPTGGRPGARRGGPFLGAAAVKGAAGRKALVGESPLPSPRCSLARFLWPLAF